LVAEGNREALQRGGQAEALNIKGFGVF